MILFLAFHITIAVFFLLGQNYLKILQYELKKLIVEKPWKNYVEKFMY